ncbi:MAG TPA: glycosyltransferase family 1 protein, partial [Candidatus Atribacteria bacterium]|nr:glycosyltransferase family 1 protein [Candidatus Atribacteria bacterium]
KECINRGIPEEKITIVPDGISDEFYLSEDKNELRSKLENKFKVSLINKKILLSVGRLVERKGFHWFVKNVIPKLLKQRNDFVYLIAGDGIFRERIKNAIANNGLEERVIMLGNVDDEALKLLYNASDIFVMPNMPVEGDMEGFGIVALEAASCGVPVVASRLEGIKDAIKNEKNGFLVEPYDVDEFVGVIDKLLDNNGEREGFGKRAREFTLENYSWEKIAEKIFRRI